jgi:hypothetical protein
MKTRYRIVVDAYCGYEAQVRYWWFPFVWWQIDGLNTFISIEAAERFIEKKRRMGSVVKIIN